MLKGIFTLLFALVSLFVANVKLGRLNKNTNACAAALLVLIWDWIGLAATV